MGIETHIALGLLLLSCCSLVESFHHVCPYNFSSLDFQPAVSACSERNGNSDCCKSIEALVLVAASQYAKSTGSLCLSKELLNPCLNSMVAALDSSGVRPEASRFCGVPLGLKGHCLCRSIKSVRDFSRLAGLNELTASCNYTRNSTRNCDRCSSAMMEKFTAVQFDSSKTCRYATVVALASHGDPEYATQQANCFLDLHPERQQSSEANCPVKLAPWQLENVANVCRSSNPDPSACCSLTLLMLRVAASNLTKATGSFFMSQKQARSCIQELTLHMSRLRNIDAGHEPCSISSDSIFNSARRGCNNILTISELEHRLLDRNTNLSLVVKPCGASSGATTCPECRRAALNAAYAAAWPYFDAVTLQSCMDLTLMMLASYSSLSKGTEIGGCLYSLPVFTPGGNNSIPAAQDNVSASSSLPAPDTRQVHQASSSTSSLVIVLAIGVGVTGASAGLMFLLVVCVKHKKEESMPLWSKSSSDEDMFNPTKSYRYKDIQQATSNFRNVIGEGRSGIVYRARFKDGLVAAVKRLKNKQTTAEADRDEFINEIHFLARLHHRHLVRLRGFCLRKHERFLIYDLLENGSLKDHLTSGCSTLSWKRRVQIALEVATGLEYVHCYCEPSLCHRDVKSSNILLDSNFVAKVGDFRISATGTHAAGTPGYIDPEFATTGKLTQKSDVYSYGVLLLELISAKPVTGEQNDDIVDWALSYLDSSFGVALEIADPKLGGKLEHQELSRLVKVARLCTLSESRMRPSMKQVVNLLLDDSDATFPPLCFNPRSSNGPSSSDKFGSTNKHHQRCLSDGTSLSTSVHSAATLHAPSLSSNFVFAGPSSSLGSSFNSSGYFQI